MNQEDVRMEHVNMNMLDFCKCLYEDISANMEDWAAFDSSDDSVAKEKEKQLTEYLKTLKEWIESREIRFADKHYFL